MYSFSKKEASELKRENKELKDKIKQLEAKDIHVPKPEPVFPPPPGYVGQNKGNRRTLLDLQRQY